MRFFFTECSLLLQVRQRSVVDVVNTNLGSCSLSSVVSLLAVVLNEYGVLGSDFSDLWFPLSDRGISLGF